MKTTIISRITIELDDQEAMILAVILGNINGTHDWRKFTGQLYTELLDCVGHDKLFEFGKNTVKYPMTLGE